MNKIKSKLLVVALCLASAFAVFGIVGCGHSHTYAEEWTKDETSHWHAATCEHTDEKSAVGEHTYGDWSVVTAATDTADGLEKRTCTVCGYEESRAIAASHTHTYADAWSKDETYHWHAATCSHGDEESDKALHNWGAAVETVKATCQQAGVKTYTCKDCGQTKEEGVAMLSHDLVESEVAATCTEHGYHLVACKNCDYEAKSNFVTALGHDYSDATCSEPQICRRDGCDAVGQPALGHTYEVAGTPTEATCVDDATVTYTCRNCNDSYTVITEKATGHTFKLGEYAKKTPVNSVDVCYTLTAICSVCGAEDSDHVQNVAHSMATRTTRIATCSSEGEKTYYCLNEGCEHTHTQSYSDPDAHTWNEGVTADGVITYTCTGNTEHTRTAIVASGTTAQVSASALKDAGEVALDNASIALDDDAKSVLEGKDNVTVGAEILSGEDLDAALKALGETMDTDNKVYNFTMTAGDETIANFNGKVTVRVPYTLAEEEDPDNILIVYINGNQLEEINARYVNGYAEFETEHFSYYTVTRMTPEQRCEKFGHAYRVQSRQATCTETGYTLKICSRCGHREESFVEATGHEWEIVTVAATCTTDGSTTFTCKTCGDTYTVKLPATGHDWVVTEKVAATCTAEGKTVSVCNICGEKHTVTETLKKHNFKVTVVAPDCRNNGYTHSVCVSCGLESKTDFVPSAGHKVETRVIAPTCTVQGHTEEVCTVCGEVISIKDITPATGHTMVNGVCTVCGAGCSHDYQAGKTVAPTCTESGYTVYECTKCHLTRKDNVKSALGHDFGIEECSRCHTVNPAKSEYYLNMLDSLAAHKYSIRFENVNVDLKTVDSVTDAETTAGTIEQLALTEIYFGVAEDGTLEGAGLGKIHYSDNNAMFTIDVKVIIEDRFVYLVYDCDDPNIIPFRYMMCGIDYYINGTSQGTLDYDSFKDYVVWLNTDVKAVLDSVANANAAEIVTVLSNIFNNKQLPLFNREDTQDGYVYAFNAKVFEILNDNFLKTSTADKVYELIAGTGSFAKLADGVTELLDMTVPQAIEKVGEYGLDKTQVCTAIDSLYYLVKGEKISSADVIDNNEALGDMTVAQLIATAMQQLPGGGASPDPDTKPNPVPNPEPEAKAASDESDGADEGEESVKQTVAQAIELVRTKTVYEILASVLANKTGGMTAEQLYEEVRQVIAKMIPEDGDIGAGLVIETSKDGIVRNLQIAFDGFDMPVGDDRVTGLNGKITIVPEGEISIDRQAIKAEINAALPVITTQNGAPLTVTAKENHGWTESGIERDVTEKSVAVFADGNGGVERVQIKTVTIRRENIQIDSKYAYYNETVTTSVNEYVIATGDCMIAFGDTCGDWVELYVSGLPFGNKQVVAQYMKKISLETGKEVYSIPVNSEETSGSQSSYADIWINVKENDILVFNYFGGKHNYVCVDEKSKFECGGFEYYECEYCHKSYTRNIVHYGEEKETCELVAGATSCEDGVTVTWTCGTCGKLISSYTTYYHHTYEKEVYDLSDYGAVCGGRLIVEGCACGEAHPYIRLEGACDFDSHWVSSEDSETQKTLYVCSVEDCGFAYVRVTTETVDSACNVVTTVKYILGVTPGYTEENGWSYTGGKKTVQYTYRGGKSHQWAQRTVSETSTSWIYEEYCARCGEKFRRTEISYTYDSDGNQLITKTEKRIDYFDIFAGNTGEIIGSGYNISESSYRYIYKGERQYEIITRYRVDRYEYGKVESWTLKEYSYENGVYCQATVTETDSDGNTKTYQEIDHRNDRLVSVATCTQNAVYSCIFCDAESESEWSYYGHDYVPNEEGDGFVCTHCGLENEKGADGNVILEDLTGKYDDYADDYVVGYAPRDKYEYDRWWKDGEYEFSLWLIDTDGDPEGDNEYDITGTVDVNRKAISTTQNGKVWFSIADVQAAAAERGLTNYQVRLCFVPTGSGMFDYNITLDARASA